MNGPLLLTLLPPEPAAGALNVPPDQAPYLIAVLLLAGFLLSLRIRPPRH
jgi:hypothetical protein